MYFVQANWEKFVNPIHFLEKWVTFLNFWCIFENEYFFAKLKTESIIHENQTDQSQAI
jgi:hypothetical protein